MEVEGRRQDPVLSQSGQRARRPRWNNASRGQLFSQWCAVTNSQGHGHGAFAV